MVIHQSDYQLAKTYITAMGEERMPLPYGFMEEVRRRGLTLDQLEEIYDELNVFGF